MRKLLFFLLIVAVFFSCKQAKKELSKDSCIIEGSIKDAVQKTIVLQKITYQEVINIDSVVLNEDGRFLFTVKPKEREIYLLRKDGNHYISIIADKGEIITLGAAYDDFEKSYTIKGSPDSELLLKLNNHLQPNLHKLDSLGKIWEIAINDANRESIKKDLDACYLKIVANQRAFQLNFILKNSSSLAALFAVYQPLNREPMLKEETDFAVFEKVSNDLLKALPTNSHAINFAKKMKQRKMLELEKKLSQKSTSENNH